MEREILSHPSDKREGWVGCWTAEVNRIGPASAKTIFVAVGGGWAVRRLITAELAGHRRCARQVGQPGGMPASKPCDGCEASAVADDAASLQCVISTGTAAPRRLVAWIGQE
jgi:hypothetical protein